MKAPNYITTICLLFILLIVSCSTDDGPSHSPLIDLGIEDAEVQTRLTTSLVGQLPDGDGNPENLCADGAMQLMADDPYCGYVDVGEFAVNLINEYRAKHNLPPYVRAIEYELCAAREARLAVENGVPHWNDGCGWRSQGSTGGGRGGDDSSGTVEKSVAWVPKLFYQEGPNGGHYQAMMEKRSRGVAVGYYAIDRDSHRIVVNYYDSL
ncbi:CAP domain-containing protein [Seonamhaeicola sp.]|uniref:CAP domain-containing protein n=1 Tax=Seonamhaeicola sp. TaxID=1912245 RepID=UPI002617ADF1|nr:CAP domain-containing protein [Seonamhaeicola sp.]